MRITAPLISQRWFRFALAGTGEILLSQVLLVPVLAFTSYGLQRWLVFR